MNEVLKAMKQRRSIRAFKPDAVPAELIDQIIEAGLYAASGMNRQETIIVAVTDKAVRDRLSKTNASIMGGNMDPFYGAPVVLVVLASRAYPTYIYDGTLVMQNLMLSAHSLGIGSCWIHRAKEVFMSPYGTELKKKLGIPEKYVAVGNCILGYPETVPAARPRREGYIIKV
jgi:nitroreductase